jgi:ubiquinone/menaquinone biosynthesis C-methylase UbiE
MAEDLFSQQAAFYARYRPSYPAALIDYIIQFVPEKNCAWDCATGNGQAAILLADRFEKVFATDSSEKQLSFAVQKSNIIYSAGNAADSGFADDSFDLVTVAQAYHWLDFYRVEQEVNRVGKPGAVIAAWGYHIPQCAAAPVNQLINRFYKITVGPYWDAERKYIDDYYRTVPFNFKALPEKGFSIAVNWKPADLAGYINSWSSVQHFTDANHYNPVEELLQQLLLIWPTAGASLPFSFPLFLRLGRIEK